VNHEFVPSSETGLTILYVINGTFNVSVSKNTNTSMPTSVHCTLMIFHMQVDSVHCMVTSAFKSTIVSKPLHLVWQLEFKTQSH